VFSRLEQATNLGGVPGQGAVQHAVGIHGHNGVHVLSSDHAGGFRVDDGTGIQSVFLVVVYLQPYEFELGVTQDSRQCRTADYARRPLNHLVCPWHALSSFSVTVRGRCRRPALFCPARLAE
jgi:hypothetical protein